VLEGHTGRVWDVVSNARGDLIASGAADRLVKLWKAGSHQQCIATLGENKGDIYSVCLHPKDVSRSKTNSRFSFPFFLCAEIFMIQTHVAAAGYDKIVRLYDLETSSLLKTFTGHSLGASDVVFNPLGNLLVSGAKDATIRIWDVVSGLCIRTITSHLGEVTSVRLSEDGTKLLSASKDNAHRLWDVRMVSEGRLVDCYYFSSLLKNGYRTTVEDTSEVQRPPEHVEEFHPGFVCAQFADCQRF
jgi:COMPASS component SWD3